MRRIYFQNKSEDRRYFFFEKKQFGDESNDGLQIKNDRQKRLLNPFQLRTVIYLSELR